MNSKDLSKKDIKTDSSLNNPPIGGLPELVAIEWELIERLKQLAYSTQDEKARVQYFLSLSSHARTLAYLLGQCGAGADEKEDLAKLLAEISKKARRILRGLNRGRIITNFEG